MLTDPPGYSGSIKGKIMFLTSLEFWQAYSRPHWFILNSRLAVTQEGRSSPNKYFFIKKTHFSIAKVLQIPADNVYKTGICPDLREA